MLINVTQDHIDKGEVENCKSCPIALAMLEQIPNASEVYVNSDGADVCIGPRRLSSPFYTHFASVPDEAQDFMDAFDEGLPVQPFTFELELVPE